MAEIKPGNVKNHLNNKLLSARNARIETIFETVINATPVDTGNLVGNWQVDSILNNSEFEAQGSTRHRMVRRMQKKVRDIPLLEDIFMFNNTYYAKYVLLKNKIVRSARKKSGGRIKIRGIKNV